MYIDMCEENTDFCIFMNAMHTVTKELYRIKCINTYKKRRETCFNKQSELWLFNSIIAVTARSITTLTSLKFHFIFFPPWFLLGLIWCHFFKIFEHKSVLILSACPYLFSMALQPKSDLGCFIVEVSTSHTVRHTHTHTR